MISGIFDRVKDWADARTLRERAAVRAVRGIRLPRWKKTFKPMTIEIRRSFEVHLDGRVYLIMDTGELRRVEDPNVIKEVMFMVEARREKLHKLKGEK